MKKPIIIRLIAVLTFLFTTISYSNAGHIGRFELNYEHVSGTTYKIYAVMYTACTGGAGAPNSISIAAKSDSLSVNSSAAVILNRVANSTTLPLNPPNIFNCNSIQPCFNEYTYMGTIDLSVLHANPYAEDWVFYSQSCCTQPNIYNIASGNVYGQCTLNNKDFPMGNNSPFFHDRRAFHNGFGSVINHPFESICAGVLNIMNQGAAEADGDIVRYSFITPLATPTTTLSYNNGHTFANPIPFTTPPGFEIDSITGEIELLVPATSPTRNYYIGIRATEFRMDTVYSGPSYTLVRKEVGSVDRTLLISVESAATCADKNFNFEKNSLSSNCVDNEFVIEMSHKFQCNTVDHDASFIVLTDSASGVSMTVDSVTVDSCWNGLLGEDFRMHLPLPLGAGTYYLALQNGTDGNTIVSECENEMTPFADTITIRIDSSDKPFMLGSKDSLGNRLSYVIRECGQDFVDLEFSKKVLCSTIENSGSDFVVVDSNTAVPQVMTISSVTLLDCDGVEARRVRIRLSSQFASGSYGLFLKQGTDGNTVLDKCNNEADLAEMPIQVESLEFNLGPDLEFCEGEAYQVTLDPGNNYFSYSWNTGTSNRTLIISNVGNYILTVSNFYGCSYKDTVFVTEKDCTIGIEDNSDSEIHIYPNPVLEGLNFEFGNNVAVNEIKIFDQNGKLVNVDVRLSQSGATVSLNVDKLTSGMYYLNIKGENGKSYLGRFIKK